MLEQETAPHIPYFNKYRPYQFKDVAQPGMTKILLSQIQGGTTCGSYLFSGTAGTGKTTTARIVAQALFCEDLKEGEPCGECRSCRDVRSGRHRDVMEMNCATHGKVEDIRDLIAENVIISPTRGKWRVFILDESHLITTSGQAALLKIVEEPPPYVKFFFCTTDPQKISAAIITRCQHYALGRVGIAALNAILRKVVQSESLEFEDSALSLIASASEGSARKALVLLEQISGVGVTEENARIALRRSSEGVALDLLEAVFSINRSKAFQIIEAAHLEGRDMGQLMLETAQHIMAAAKYRIFATPAQEQDIRISKFVTGYSTAKGKTLPGLSSQQVQDSVTSLIDISKQIRQNVPAELAASVGILKTIDGFVKSRSAL